MSGGGKALTSGQKAFAISHGIDSIVEYSLSHTLKHYDRVIKHPRTDTKFKRELTASRRLVAQAVKLLKQASKGLEGDD